VRAAAFREDELDPDAARRLRLEAENQRLSRSGLKPAEDLDRQRHGGSGKPDNSDREEDTGRRTRAVSAY
jgi:hypothetical protein